MIRMGLEEEAKRLCEFKNLNALNTVGYRELFEVFDGKITKEEAIELIKRNSRRYAKRQLTWWSKDKDIKWFDPVKVNEIIEYISKTIYPLA
jgi:tRNA dimethylallyltransferase